MKIYSAVLTVFISTTLGLGTLAADWPKAGNPPVDSKNIQSLTVRVSSPGLDHCQITETSAGHRIVMEGFGHIMVVGKPMLPSKNFLIALPPGARALAARVEGMGATELPGIYRIKPVPPLKLLVDPAKQREADERMRLEWQENNESTYSSDEAYPSERGKITGSGTLRKYSYASVSFYPFSYYPRSGRLIRYDGARIIIDYSIPKPGSTEARRAEELKWDEVADERARELFINYDQVEALYVPGDLPGSTGSRAVPEPFFRKDYVIITASYLNNAIAASDFPNWKTSLGYNLETVYTNDARITGQPGSDLAEQIRNFLRSYYVQWGIEYVLLVGDNETVPMPYCYPDPATHSCNPGNPWDYWGCVPTDYYYADLSYTDAESWDSDGDGYRGEYGQDDPDFLAEISVGRIPTDNIERITYALDKLVSFEQDTGDWKNSALQPGAILFFENQDYNGYGLMDGATCLDYIETDIMDGWTVSHYSEQEGLQTSTYDWPAISESAFTSDWRNGQYGVVNWAAHGAHNSTARSVWEWDDGDGVPESNELSWYTLISTYSNLEDDYPSILFAISCLVGYPEYVYGGNLGVKLLTKPGFGACSAVVSATRPAAIAVEWPSSPGGAESMCYEFNRYMIDGPDGPERVGDALYDSKFYCNFNYGWDHWYEYQNMFNYNLYGDPAMVREGVY